MAPAAWPAPTQGTLVAHAAVEAAAATQGMHVACDSDENNHLYLRLNRILIQAIDKIFP
jgi:hypothetical protein